MKNRLVVFDWDGTLVDSTDRIVDAMQHAFRQRDWQIPASQSVSRLIGLPVSRMIDELSGGAPASEQSAATTDFAIRFRELAVEPPRTFDGLRACLAALIDDGLWLAVATGKSRRGLDRELAQLGLRDQFVATRTADESRPKPDPQMLLELLDECGVAPSDIIMVGDTVFDMQMAQSAEVRAIGVSWGNHTGDELAADGALAVLTHLRELPTIAAGLFKTP